jgi:ABC-type oligopeptide transport system substrate-binding subunit
MRRLIAVLLVIALQTGLPAVGSAQTGGPAPAGQMTWAVHFTLAPRWLDPAESEGSITPFLTLYAVHDAMLKPMPSGPAANSLAESWTVSPNGLVYDFTLRRIRRILHEKKIFAPIWENGFIRGVGPRVEEPALALIPAFPYSAPYEDVRLKP